jgi:hypothetical protein
MAMKSLVLTTAGPLAHRQAIPEVGPFADRR